MGKKYKNPPIIEALCEFRVTSETQWDLTVPGIIYEQLKESFPGREPRIIQELELIQGPDASQRQIHTRAREGVIFFTENKEVLVQVGPHLLSIHVFKPYPHWEGFKPRIEMAWKSLQMAVKIQGLERIALRYINQIELPGQEVRIAEYFEFYPYLGPKLPQNVSLFFAGVYFLYSNDRDLCRIQLYPLAPLREKISFRLDIEYFLAKPRAVEVADAIAWVEEAHSRVEEVFEVCITDKLREMFGVLEYEG
jgi:uncharacterized protein (TIGR04255 family)